MHSHIIINGIEAGSVHISTDLSLSQTVYLV